MRFEVVDATFSKHTRTVELPRGVNQVLIGTGADCQVRLTAHVGERVAGLRLKEDGRWWFSKLSDGGHEIRVGPIALGPDAPVEPAYTLWDRGETVLLPEPQLRVTVDRYQLTIVFDPEEFAPRSADADRLDRQMIRLVQEVHADLTRELVKTNADPKEKYRPEYIMRLEQLAEQLAGRRPDFPADDLTRTTLCDHVAGAAVKSALIRRMIAQSGQAANRDRRTAESDSADWVRLRTEVADWERELDRLVERAGKAVDAHEAAAGDDLSARMRVLGEVFWPFWRAVLDDPKAPGLGARRYFALRRIKEEVKNYWYGFGPLEDLLDDPTVSEIMVVDREHVFIETGGQLEDSGRRFLTDPLTVIKKIVNVGDREVNDSQPLANVRMPDGSRMHAVHPCLALKGAALTIRKFPKVRLTIEQLIDKGSITAPAAAFLRAAVVNRRNILVSGGTGTGKTTLLNCLSTFIPDKERIVTIEDTAELQLQKEHVVTLQGRPSNIQGEGEVSIRELVRNALRMRPDRVVVGECRAAEALDMLQAMNTGHDGSLTTLHANNPSDVIQRLETMCQQASKDLPVDSIHRMVASAVDLVVQLSRGYAKTAHPDGTVTRKPVRVVSEIAEVVGLATGGGIVIKSLFARPPEGGPLRPTGCLPTFLPDMVDAGLVPDPLAFLRDPVTDPPPAPAVRA